MRKVVYTCDRCGKEFTHNGWNDYKELHICVGSAYVSDDVDLCKKCGNGLIDVIKDFLKAKSDIEH